MTQPHDTDPGPGTTGPTGPAWAAPRLRRPHQGRLLGGVAAGLAEYFAVDVAVVRLAIVVLTLLGGIGLPAYVTAWVLVPDECDEASLAEDWLAHHGRAA